MTPEELKGFDAVFVGGGDSAVLCREMVRTGFDRVLEQAVDDGLVYVGISAGSMYAAGNLDDGLHIIPSPIIAHWNGDKLLSLPTNGKEIHLVDGQAVYIREYSATSNRLKYKQLGVKYGKIGAREMEETAEKACTKGGGADV